MRKTAFLLFMGFTYYMAGMYRYFPLMVLCVLELLFVIVLFCMPRYFKRRLTVGFLQRSTLAEKETELPCVIKVKNTAEIPVNCLEFRMRFQYAQEKRAHIKRLAGGSDCGEDSLQFQFLAPCCGLVKVTLDHLRVYDYLSLFSSGLRLKEEMQIAIFPKTQALHIQFSSFTGSENFQTAAYTDCKKGDNPYEIRQIREYRAGDSNRHIHWKLSARTDKFQIREFEKETDSCVDVCLDTSGLYHMAKESAGAFYELASALVLGLLEHAAVRIYWYDAVKSAVLNGYIENAAECKDMLFLLYQTAPPEKEQTETVRRELLIKDALLLDAELCLYLNQMPVYRFSEKNIEREIAEKILFL